MFASEKILSAESNAGPHGQKLLQSERSSTELAGPGDYFIYSNTFLQIKNEKRKPSLKYKLESLFQFQTFGFETPLSAHSCILTEYSKYI